MYERAGTALKTEKATRLGRIRVTTFDLMEERGVGPEEMIPALVLAIRDVALAPLELQEPKSLKGVVEKPLNKSGHRPRLLNSWRGK